MLKCKIDKKKGIVNIKTEKNTTAHNIAVETLGIIKTIHKVIHEKKPELAELYRISIIGALIDPESPVWKVDDHGET